MGGVRAAALDDDLFGAEADERRGDAVDRRDQLVGNDRHPELGQGGEAVRFVEGAGESCGTARATEGRTWQRLRPDHPLAVVPGTATAPRPRCGLLLEHRQACGHGTARPRSAAGSRRPGGVPLAAKGGGVPGEPLDVIASPGDRDAQQACIQRRGPRPRIGSTRPNSPLSVSSAAVTSTGLAVAANVGSSALSPASTVVVGERRRAAVSGVLGGVRCQHAHGTRVPTRPRARLPPAASLGGRARWPGDQLPSRSAPARSRPAPGTCRAPAVRSRARRCATRRRGCPTATGRPLGRRRGPRCARDRSPSATSDSASVTDSR